MKAMLETQREAGAWRRFDPISVSEAHARIRDVVKRTRLIEFDAGDSRIHLRLKLENEQETGAFKARGAFNQVSQLTPEERERGIVCSSSGNHGRAVAWAAGAAGVRATIFMPENAYPNKIAACRELGAEVVLTATRASAETECQAAVERGGVLIHPYDAERTIAGAGTVGLELAEDWPEVEVCVFPMGGGGLISGSSLALRRALGEELCILGVEPAGAPSMWLGVEAGEPVALQEITTDVQGLCPVQSGNLNVAVVRAAVDRVHLIEDGETFAAQRLLVQAGHVVEPAGAAAFGLVRSGGLPEDLLAGRDASNPLRVCAIVSGGNPDPAQLRGLRGDGAE